MQVNACALPAVAASGTQPSTAKVPTTYYIFRVSDNGERAVFYSTEDEATARELCRLIRRDFLTEDPVPVFEFAAAEKLDPDECMLFDERIEQYAQLSYEPDWGVYEFSFSTDVHFLTKFARSAIAWEKRLHARHERGAKRSQAAPSARAGPLETGFTEDEIANAIVSTMLLRDLIELRRDYPGAVRDEEAATLFEALANEIDCFLEKPALAPLRAEYKRPAFQSAQPSDISWLIGFALLQHASANQIPGGEQATQSHIESVVRECEAKASPSLMRMAERIKQMMFADCRFPTAPDRPAFADARRHLQMLTSYWGLCRSLIIQACGANVGYQPFPLMPLIENLRDRIARLFEELSELDGALQAEHAIDVLLETLTGSEPDALSIEEWTHEQTSLVEQFLARSSLRLGSAAFELTSAEKLFITAAEKCIADHGQRLQAGWRCMVAQVEQSQRRKDEGNQSVIVIDENLFQVSYRGTPCTFSAKQKQLLDLLGRLVASHSRAIAFDTLREKDNVWDGARVTDQTIRGTISRLRNHLQRNGLRDLASTIKTRTFRGRATVLLDQQQLRRQPLRAATQEA